jgi:hypothetical protein
MSSISPCAVERKGGNNPLARRRPAPEWILRAESAHPFAAARKKGIGTGPHCERDRPPRCGRRCGVACRQRNHHNPRTSRGASDSHSDDKVRHLIEHHADQCIVGTEWRLVEARSTSVEQFGFGMASSMTQQKPLKIAHGMAAIATVAEPIAALQRRRHADVRVGSLASNHLSPLSNQGGHDPTSARREVPATDSCTAANDIRGLRHSINSSARASSEGDTARPIALAVLRLKTSLNFVGICTGRSPGFCGEYDRRTPPSCESCPRSRDHNRQGRRR